MSEHYSNLTRRLRETATLGSVGELLAWDQETMMPRGAARFRAEELAMVSSLVHQKATDTVVGDLIALLRGRPGAGRRSGDRGESP